MRLSYSSISDYLNCPLKYKFRHIDKLPTKKTPALSFGSSLHETLAYLYGVKTPHPPALEQIQEKLKEEWISEGYSSEAEEKQYFEHAKQVLTNFYHTNVSSFKLPVALERKFGVQLDGITVTGIIDRLDMISEGKYEVIDYKTNRKLPPKSKIDSDLQLSIYHWATKQIWGFAPKSVSLYFLLPNHKMSSTRSQKQIQETLDTIKQVADKVEKKLFEPTQSALCPWCDFQQFCPYFSHKFAKKEDEIEKIVEEYGALKDKEKELKARIKEAAQQISAHLKGKKELRLFSANYEVLKSVRKTISFDEVKVANILKPLGFWDKVVSLDNKKLSELLENGGLEEEIKNQILENLQKKESFVLTCKSPG